MSWDDNKAWIVTSAVFIVVIVFLLIPNDASITGKQVAPSDPTQYRHTTRMCENMESCTYGGDRDRDGYAGCDDIDCYNLLGSDCPTDYVFPQDTTTCTTVAPKPPKKSFNKPSGPASECEDHKSCIDGSDKDSDGYQGCDDIDCYNLLGSDCPRFSYVYPQKPSCI